MSKNDVIIKIEHLKKSFGDHEVLNDFNIEIKRGEFLTILGPSGCGKTTILRTIAGFIKPDSGKVFMEGQDITDLPPHKRTLNTVFQRYALFPHLDVYDNIAFGLKLKKKPKSEIDQKVKRVLKLVSMSDYEDRDVNSLSGGQQQRIAIARALINHPQVLLLDEPLAALDLKMRKDMQIELKEMHQKLGITFIYVTHDQEEALTLSDTIVVMNEGSIQQIGTPTDIYNEPVNSFVANFIGESNILNGIMLEDKKVSFIDKTFECVDGGFAENEPVDVVIRPEDVYIMSKIDNAQFTGTVSSCTFKGVHYEMFVNTDEGFEIQVQDYNAFAPGSRVGMIIRPNDIQVMKKKRLCNTFEGVMKTSSTVEIDDVEIECPETEFSEGDEVLVQIPFDKVDILDNEEEGAFNGNIDTIYYKGNHYHIKIKTENGISIYADTNDIWDKHDLVGVNFIKDGIKVSRKND